VGGGGRGKSKKKKKKNLETLLIGLGWEWEKQAPVKSIHVNFGIFKENFWLKVKTYLLKRNSDV